MGATDPVVESQVVCIDPHRQWRRAANVRNSATLRSVAPHADRPRPLAHSSELSAGRRMTTPDLDAIVVGAGPNGLAAAVTLARAGRSVRVYEASRTIGGGTRTQELTLPGFRHDVCSTILPLTLASPFFRTIDWNAHGVELVHPDAPRRSRAGRRARRGAGAVVRGDRGRARRRRRTDDGGAWLRLFGPLARDARKLVRGAAAAGRPRPAPPAGACPVRAAGAALRRRAWPGAGSAGEAARALFAGLAAHSMLAARSAADRLVRARARHVRPRRRLADGPRRVDGGRRRPGCRAACARRRDRHRRAESTRLGRSSRRPGPCCSTRPRGRWWPSPATACRRAPGGGTRRSATARACSRSTGRSTARSRGPPTACGARPRSTSAGRWTRSRRSEADVAAGRHPDRPFTLLRPVRPVGPERARPPGKTTAWAYCHVPSGSDVDMTDRIEAQVERFAPGFRDRILARATPWAGRDGGARRELRRRRHQRRRERHPPAPVPPDRARLDPYHAGPGLYLCSSSTPPGGGVHGMSGYLAARSALRRDLALTGPRPDRVAGGTRGAATCRCPAPHRPARPSTRRGAGRGS